MKQIDHTMRLKEFIDKVMEESPIEVFKMAEKLIELESIERSLNLLYGIELEIQVKPAPKIEGRFYGKSLIEALKK